MAPDRSSTTRFDELAGLGAARTSGFGAPHLLFRAWQTVRLSG